MKLFVLILVGFSFFIGCGKSKSAANQAITDLRIATKNLEDKSGILDSDPPQIEAEKADIEEVESAIAVLKKALAKKDVSKKTKATANQAIEEANQAIEAASRDIKIVNMAFYRHIYIEDLMSRIADLRVRTEKVREAYLAHATSASYIEEIIGKARYSMYTLRDRVAEVSANISQAGNSEGRALVNEAIEEVNQAIAKANRAIAEADQAIKDLLTLS